MMLLLLRLLSPLLLGLILAPRVGARIIKSRGSDPPPRVVPCEEPVRRAPVRLPASLAGAAPHSFEMNSGYINVTEADYLFYWHFEAQRPDPNPENPAPIILWSNGGPGCSAMVGGREA